MPSFYSYSKVDDKYSVLKHPELKDEIFITDYHSTHYVRMMKLFQTNPGASTDPMENKRLEDPSQKDFFVRCYLPISKISHMEKEGRIKQVVVMFNGLNECTRYDLYDVLGAQFAEYGIATILLPTPYHLNRRIDRDETKRTETRSMEEPNQKNFEMPTDMGFDDCGLYYYSFKRSIRELEELVKRIEKPVKVDKGFFENYFTRKPEITLFGFSLGGLRALTCFLRNPEKYHSCITFNSGVDLKRVNTRDLHLDSKEWEKTFNKIPGLLDEPDFTRRHKKDREILDYFRWLYLGRTEFDKFVKKLECYSKKYLFVQSGADTLFKVGEDPTTGLANPQHGLNRIIVAGVGHIPTTDLRWDNWLTKVGENIVHFINGRKDDHWPHAKLEEKIGDLIKGTAFFAEFNKPKGKERDEFFEGYDFSAGKFKSLLSQVDEPNRQLLEELYYVSKAFYPKFSELLEKISRPEKSVKSPRPNPRK